MRIDEPWAMFNVHHTDGVQEHEHADCACETCVHTNENYKLFCLVMQSAFGYNLHMTSLLANPLLLGFIILTIATLILLGLVIWMYFKLRTFLVVVDAHNIGDSLTHVAQQLKDLQSFRSELETYLSDVEKRVRKSVQSVHTVRFNPFKGTGGGGNQSFATTLINEDGDGVILSSLYSRDHVSVFSKPVKNHASEFELSDEERESLEHAKKGLKKSS